MENQIIKVTQIEEINIQILSIIVIIKISNTQIHMSMITSMWIILILG